jgi:hypothetical protein|tara:strand:- start:317 stop:469 length:153 start_codon:yes stop_codon:yes gene_type:complete
MSIKHKIKFKNPVAQELRTPKYKSRVIKNKKKDDKDFVDHCRKFFKGEVE